MRKEEAAYEKRKQQPSSNHYNYLWIYFHQKMLMIYECIFVCRLQYVSVHSNSRSGVLAEASGLSKQLVIHSLDSAQAFSCSVAFTSLRCILKADLWSNVVPSVFSLCMCFITVCHCLIEAVHDTTPCTGMKREMNKRCSFMRAVCLIWRDGTGYLCPKCGLYGANSQWCLWSSSTKEIIKNIQRDFKSFLWIKNVEKGSLEIESLLVGEWVGRRVSWTTKPAGAPALIDVSYNGQTVFYNITTSEIITCMIYKYIILSI